MLPGLSTRRQAEHFWREQQNRFTDNCNQDDEYDLALLLVNEENETNKNLISSGDDPEVNAKYNCRIEYERG